MQTHTSHPFSEFSLYLKTHFGGLCISHTPYRQPCGVVIIVLRKTADLPVIVTLPFSIATTGAEGTVV